MNKRREVFRHNLDIMVQKKDNHLRKMRIHVRGIDLLQERNDIFENIFFFNKLEKTYNTKQTHLAVLISAGSKIMDQIYNG